MKRILIIDDDEHVRSMLRFRLEDAGFKVEEASDGGAGLALHREKAFALIITDLIMSGVEGIETIRALKRNHQDVKIIAISGGGRVHPDEYLNIAKMLGAHRVFAKPVDWNELIDAVNDLT
ncbi:MAG: response regulator [Planctomycetes bacterium]|nr:response regulator [Planctomycetota bacterium]